MDEILPGKNNFNYGNADIPSMIKIEPSKFNGFISQIITDKVDESAFKGQPIPLTICSSYSNTSPVYDKVPDNMNYGGVKGSKKAYSKLLICYLSEAFYTIDSFKQANAEVFDNLSEDVGVVYVFTAGPTRIEYVNLRS